MVVELLDVGIRSRGLADAQACAVVGWQDDGTDLMGFEDVATVAHEVWTPLSSRVFSIEISK